MSNPDVRKTLDECVADVLGLLTGLNLQYQPEHDRYQVIIRFLNQALRRNALEVEWSYYASTEKVGTAQAGCNSVHLRSSVRPRIISDDAVRLTHKGSPRVWAYFLPRDALHKNEHRDGLWVSITRSTLEFSRNFYPGEEGLDIEVPVMREPRLFKLLNIPETPPVEPISVPNSVRNQLLDFDYPDVVIARAAYMYAQTDPVMQPRAQTLEAEYKDIMYQLIERDQRHTDSPYSNTFLVPMTNDIYGGSPSRRHRHPHAEGRGVY